MTGAKLFILLLQLANYVIISLLVNRIYPASGWRYFGLYLLLISPAFLLQIFTKEDIK